MSRSEIVQHLLKIRTFGEDYYAWAAPRYESLYMPGLQAEIDAIWDTMAAEDRLPPWLRSDSKPPDG